MPKAVKVKRYKNIYKRRTPLSILLRVVCIVVVVGLLGFIGWSAYEPVRAYLDSIAFEWKNNPTPSLPEIPDISASPEPEAPAPESLPELPPEPAVSASEPAPAESEPAAPEGSEIPSGTQLRGAYLPVSDLLDPNLLAARLSDFQEAGYTAVLVDLKDANGSLLYRSKRGRIPLEEGVTPYDLSAVCEQIRAAGMLPIGRMHTFRDYTAALSDNNMAVQYLDTREHWLDNSREKGGKPWLNPYSEQARAYLVGLAEEAVSMGVEQILLDSVMFPVGVRLDAATYGETGDVSRSEVLSAFVRQVSSAVSAKGGTVSLIVRAADVFSNPDSLGGDPLVLSDQITLNLSPAVLGENFSAGGFTVEHPMQDPGDTVQRMLDALSGRLPGQFTALIQDPNNSTAMVQAVQEVLKENGVESYLIVQESPNPN